MDTKSKNNKKYINSRLLILSIIISILSVVIGKSSFNKKVDNFNNIKLTDIKILCSSLMDLSMYASDLEGNLKEESIASQVNEEKKIYKENVEKIEREVKERENQLRSDYNNSYNLNINIDQYLNGDNYLSVLKSQLEEAKRNLNKIDDEVREEVINNFRAQVELDLENIRRNLNVEYYFETDNPEKPIKNVEVDSVEKFVKDTKDKYKDYVMEWYDSEGKLRTDASEGLSGMFNNNKNQHNGQSRLVRVREPLITGDNIYEVMLNKEAYTISRKVNNILLGLCILTIIFLAISIYRKRKLDIKENIIVKLYSRLYLEVRLALAFLIILSWFRLFGEMIWSSQVYMNLLEIAVILVKISVMALGIYLVSSDIYRLVKRKEDIYNKSLVCKLCKYIRKSFKNVKIVIKDIYRVRSIKEKTILAIILLILYAGIIGITLTIVLLNGINIIVSIMMIISIILTAIVFKFILQIAYSIKLVKDITESIVKGNYTNNTNISSSKIIKDIVDDLSNIRAGLNEAVIKAVSSERMKSELITNVSHDLKTPLTSIINYVDLLSKENVSEDEKEKYISVLKEKSLRLKSLIEDLFEVSKVSSGNIELNMEKIDTVSLLRQTIGEFEDKIEDSELQIIKKVPENKVEVHADGRRTFRIFQNLISNILKYSLKGSRVYIEIKEEIQYVEVIFKNISKYELNFSEKEIMERFKRGDESRTTEGSGLGLAIAKSLVEIQGGEFEIVIDGDLFKAIVRLKRADINGK